MRNVACLSMVIVALALLALPWAASGAEVQT
jgi:hypothetical protein